MDCCDTYRDTILRDWSLVSASKRDHSREAGRHPEPLWRYTDVETGDPHIHRHGVTESEVEDVLRRPIEDRPGQEGSRAALGQMGAAAASQGETMSFNATRPRATMEVPIEIVPLVRELIRKRKRDS